MDRHIDSAMGAAKAAPKSSGADSAEALLTAVKEVGQMQQLVNTASADDKATAKANLAKAQVKEKDAAAAMDRHMDSAMEAAKAAPKSSGADKAEALRTAVKATNVAKKEVQAAVGAEATAAAQANLANAKVAEDAAFHALKNAMDA